MEEENKSIYSIMDEARGTDSKKNLRWIAYVLPVLIALIYAVTYLLVLPKVYGKGVGLDEWFISAPEELLEIFKGENGADVSAYKIWAFKVFMYILGIGFVVSLFNLGYVIQNKKPKYNVNAVLVDNVPYLRAMEINEVAKGARCTDAGDAQKAIRNVMEHLRNESSFGIGNDAVIACEREIAKCLKEIEENVQALYDDKTAKEAGDVITASCKVIQTKLKIRTEMKKR